MEDRGEYIWVPWKEWLHDSAGVVNPRWGINLPAQYLVKHHTPGIDPQSFSDAVEALNGVWYYHTFVAEGGWGWIGYNTIGWGKFIFEGAGIGNRGIHAPNANGVSHGHAFLLDSRDRQPTRTEWAALRALVGDLIAQRYLDVGIVIDGSGQNTVHHDWVATACAGPGVDATAYQFYSTSPIPTPNPNPTRRRRGTEMRFEPRMNGNVPHQWNPGSWGIQWASKSYDCAVPAGYKVMVVPTSQISPEFTCSAIVNGNQKQPLGCRLDQPYVLEITVDSYVTVCVPYDVEPNISVG